MFSAFGVGLNEEERDSSDVDRESGVGDFPTGVGDFPPGIGDGVSSGVCWISGDFVPFSLEWDLVGGVALGCFFGSRLTLATYSRDHMIIT